MRQRTNSGASRRDLLKLMGVGGVVFSSGLARGATKKKKSDVDADFMFLQLSDTHWGYSGLSNPMADVPLKKAIETINATAVQPDFIVFTGDLTHTTDDGAVRHKRMAEFKDIAGGLKVQPLHLLPGEHDAGKDAGAAYQQHFGPLHHAFDHKGVHFVALDNVSDPAGAVGDKQIDWLAADLRKVGREAPIVVLAHRPLFDLAPDWDWMTRDGGKVVDVLLPYRHVTVFYGHIHQEHHHLTEHIAHHAARSLIFPLPAPMSVPKKAPLPFDPSTPFKGIGYRRVEIDGRDAAFTPKVEELPIVP